MIHDEQILKILTEQSGLREVQLISKIAIINGVPKESVKGQIGSSLNRLIREERIIKGKLNIPGRNCPVYSIKQ